MGLFIYDATQRIVTPLAVDLQRRTIQQLSPTAATAPVRPKFQESDPLTAWTQTYRRNQGKTQAEPQSAQEQASGSRLTAAEIMTPKVVTLSETDSWRQARQLFQAHGIRHLVLTDPQALATGLLLERDLLSYPDEHDKSLASLPKRPLLSATPDTDVQSIALVMLNRDIDAVLVLGGQTIEGIVTIKDLLKAFAPQQLIRNEV